MASTACQAGRRQAESENPSGHGHPFPKASWTCWAAPRVRVPAALSCPLLGMWPGLLKILFHPWALAPWEVPASREAVGEEGAIGVIHGEGQPVSLDAEPAGWLVPEGEGLSSATGFCAGWGPLR